MRNSLPKFTHEDERRMLIEWIVDYQFKTAKVIIMKKATSVGDHYHKEKEEIFFLLKGKGEVELDGVREELKEGDIVFANRGVKHTFYLPKNSILLEAGTKPFDETDDYK